MTRLVPFTLAVLALGSAGPVLAQNAPSDAPAASATPATPATPVNLNPIRAHLLAGRPKDALPLAQAAVLADPNNAAAHDLLGQALLGVEKPDGAITELTTATTLDAKSPALFNHLGDANLARYYVGLREWLKDHNRDLLGAVNSSVPSARPDGDPMTSRMSVLYDDAHINDRSMSQMNGKEWERYEKMAKAALAAYNQALALDASNKTAMQGKGLASLILGQWKDTEALWARAGVPPFDSFLYELARNIYDGHAMGAEAIHIWELASQADPTNAWAYWYLRELYNEFHRGDWHYDYYDGMRMVYADKISDESDSHRPSLKDAMKTLQDVADKHGDYAPAWRGIGIASLKMKDPKQAGTAFIKAASLDENDWYSQLQAGIALLNKKDAKAAQQTLTKAARLRPDSALVWRTLGFAAEQNKDQDTAVLAYERAIEAAPLWAQPELDLADLLLNRRQGADALPHLERFLELAPSAPEAKDVRDRINDVKSFLAAQKS